MPLVSATWLKETSAPRIAGGETSDK